MTVVNPGGDFESSGRFRDESDAICASWWNGPNGKKVRYCMSTIWDGLADGAGYAVLARHPSLAPSDSLQWIGTDRQIVQGFAEGSTSYISRLVQFLDRWPTSGKATGVMLAAVGWILPLLPKFEVVTNSGNWYSYAQGTNPMPPGATIVTPPALLNVFPSNWNWDGLTTNWWRAWLIIFSTGIPWATVGGNYAAAGQTWGNTAHSWGFGDPSTHFTGLTALTSQWKARHCWYPWVIVSFSNSLFDQAQPADGVHNPDGTFGRWSKIVAGQYVPSRFSNARYIDGAA